MLGIKPSFGGALAPLTAPQMTDVNPNRWGGTYEPPTKGRGGGQHKLPCMRTNPPPRALTTESLHKLFWVSYWFIRVVSSFLIEPQMRVEI